MGRIEGSTEQTHPTMGRGGGWGITGRHPEIVDARRRTRPWSPGSDVVVNHFLNPGTAMPIGTQRARHTVPDVQGTGPRAEFHQWAEFFRTTSDGNRKCAPAQGDEMSDSVGLYLNEIGRVPLLTAHEEVELSQAIEAGNAARERHAAGERSTEINRRIAAAARAKDRFIRSNLRLVVSVARRYPLPAGMELLDLIQEGNLGLEHAVDKFDWRKGFKFSTYATFWIRQSIGRALDQKASLIRLPGDRSAALRAALRSVSGDGDELDVENAMLHRLSTPTSLDRTVGHDDSNELVDLLADFAPGPEAEYMARVDDDLLDNVLSTLDSRARRAVEQRFGLDDGRRRSYREVGEELGITAEAARRLVKRAMLSVREIANATINVA